MKALVLNEADVEKLVCVLEKLVSDYESRASALQPEIIECLKILLSPRTEALGLSKEEWFAAYYETSCEKEGQAFKQIADSLQEIPVDGITGFPLRPANENDLEEGNQTL